MNKEIKRINLVIDGESRRQRFYEFVKNIEDIENENTDLRQALISIRDFSKLNLGLAEENKQDSVPKYVIKDILQIIEEVLERGDINETD